MRFFVANQPGTAGMKLLDELVREHRGHRDVGRHADGGERAGHADGVHRRAAAGNRDERRDRPDEDVQREQRPVVDAAAERDDARVEHERVHERVDDVAAEQQREPAR